MCFDSLVFNWLKFFSTSSISDVIDGVIELTDDEDLPKSWFLILKYITSKEKEAEGL